MNSTVCVVRRAVRNGVGRFESSRHLHRRRPENTVLDQLVYLFGFHTSSDLEKASPLATPKVANITLCPQPESYQLLD